jgi:hypothetical protein
MAINWPMWTQALEQFYDKQDPKFAPHKGASQRAFWLAEGTGNHQGCKPRRWVLDFTINQKDGVTRYDKEWQRDGPVPQRQMGDPGYNWSQMGNNWRFLDRDGPSYHVGKQFGSAEKYAIYINYIVDSDGTINPKCCWVWQLSIKIDANKDPAKRKVAVNVTRMKLQSLSKDSPDCVGKAKELEKGNKKQPGRPDQPGRE